MIQELCKEAGLGDCTPCDPKKWGIRKRIQIACCGQKCAVYVARKSRFLRKDAQELIELVYPHCGKEVVFFIAAPLCSKAKELLQNKGWDVRLVS